MAAVDRYINREISWLHFNQRVLHEALDDARDPISRLAFSAIYSNNLDEFFMIRVGGLRDQLRSGYDKCDIAGLTPAQQLQAIRQLVLELNRLQADITRQIAATDLVDYGVEIVTMADLTAEQYSYISSYFKEHIYPVLTPIAIDADRPFPLVLNKSLNILYKFAGDEEKYATVQVPAVLDRLLPVGAGSKRLVPLEAVIEHFSDSFFEGLTIAASGFYRLTRNADISLNQEVAEDLLSVIEASLKARKRGQVVRIEVDQAMPPALIAYLTAVHDGDAQMVYVGQPLVDLTCLFDLVPYRHSGDGYSLPAVRAQFCNQDIFAAIEQRDYLLHHPFDDFASITHLIDRAAADPAVLAIKQVLYRVSGDSPIVKALGLAALNGKQVTVVLELMARFDEANNILWAKQLEKKGCHVIFGLANKKTHAKLTLIVRRVDGEVKRYVHVSSGNYNDKTAKLYTDIGLLTCNRQMADDAAKIFNMLSSFMAPTQLSRLITAPNSLKTSLIAMLEREIDWAERGKPARFVAKFNGLVDKAIIDSLCRAADAGVSITLIIRGICCLRPASPNIKIISVVDDFLEHSRLYWYHNNGADQVFISSADCMPRNLVRRVELMTPVDQADLKAEIIDLLNIYVDSKGKARYMLPSGRYVSALAAPDDLSAQKKLAQYYRKKTKSAINL